MRSDARGDLAGPRATPMSYLALKPHVSYALVEGRSVFLDLRRDRYFALGAAAAEVFIRCRSDPSTPVDLAGSPLLATGLFEPAAEPARLEPAPVITPEREAAGTSRAGFRDVVEAAALLARARRAIRREPLERLVRSHLQASENGGHSSSHEVEMLSLRFRAARGWVPVKPSCLLDSLALCQWLARRSAFARLVIGVKLDPFAAHCWVQLESVVLNDAPDRVARYVPILAIE